MKTMQCDACDATFSAETFDGWIEQMKPHYGEAHADVMKKHDAGSQEENMKKMQEWMEQTKQKWEAIQSES